MSSCFHVLCLLGGSDGYFLSSFVNSFQTTGKFYLMCVVLYQVTTTTTATTTIIIIIIIKRTIIIIINIIITATTTIIINNNNNNNNNKCIFNFIHKIFSVYLSDGSTTYWCIL